MREINHLRRNIRDKPGKGGFELGKAGAFSQFLPDSTRLFPSLHNSITPQLHYSITPTLHIRFKFSMNSPPTSFYKVRPSSNAFILSHLSSKSIVGLETTPDWFWTEGEIAHGLLARRSQHRPPETITGMPLFVADPNGP